MAIPCKRTEPVLTHFKNGVTLRKLNKKITIIITKEGAYLVTFIRVLSKEEKEKLKETENYPMSFITKGLLVNTIGVSKDTLLDLLGIFEYLGDDNNLDNLVYTPETKEDE